MTKQRFAPSEVAAVVVSYADRFAFLVQVLDALRELQVKQIFVVNNGCSSASTASMHEYAQKHSLVQIITQPTNTGSAGGYAAGLRAFEHSGHQLVWLLDDDNKPLPGSLAQLLEQYNNGQADPAHDVAVAFRQDRSTYQKAIQTHQPNLVLGTPNAFLGIHIASIVNKLFGRRKPQPTVDESCVVGPIDVAPYGGMLIPLEVLKQSGLPDERYYLYGDDLEYSYRITRNGGRNLLVLSSLIEDVDQTWHVAQQGSKFMKRLLEKSQFRLYYSVRNRIHFDRTKRVTNFFVWGVNLCLYTAATVILGIIKGRWRNVITYCAALSDGLFGRLGSNSSYQLP